MRTQIRNHRVVIFIFFLIVIGFARQLAANAYGDDPWKADELTQPADLAQTLAGDRKPVILQTGVVHLYKIGHIPGSKYAGMATTAEGLETLKKTVQETPRESEIVFYCGCCPMPDCPNIRPAYRTLREMGFKKIRLLNLPNNFTQDWQMKGYPVEKGAEASK